ncbi:MAG TPA: hypothetical protein VGR27_00710 [Longimicrobiaceae bacterium]|nr:hypothetical protein [Longimicrobiaceae bacterium]
MTESVVQLGEERTLVGILSPSPTPREYAGRPGVIFLNGGLVHRVGPNRLHVALARTIAEGGCATLRFDPSGIGDSRADTGAGRLGERRIAETRTAMDWLGRETGTDRFLLIGNCSGAGVGYLTAHADPRVVGLGLINPQAPVLMRHFLRTALSHPNTWRRLVGGRARVRDQLGQLFARREDDAAPEGAHRDIPGGLRTLAQRGVDLLLAYSEWDPGYDYYRHVLRRALDAPGVKEKIRIEIIPGADHQLSLRATQERLVHIIDHWLAEVYGHGWQ